MNDLRQRLTALEGKQSKQAPVAPAYAPRVETPADQTMAGFEAIYAQVVERLSKDPAVLSLMRNLPEIEVSVMRKRIELTDDTLAGRCACLVAEGYSDECRTASAAYDELRRRGFPTSKPNVYKECDKLALLGFLTKESSGYRSVSGMKINIIDKAA